MRPVKPPPFRQLAARAGPPYRGGPSLCAPFSVPPSRDSSFLEPRRCHASPRPSSTWLRRSPIAPHH
eukprot:7386162-Prymnesium_polylepis.1